MYDAFLLIKLINTVENFLINFTGVIIGFMNNFYCQCGLCVTLFFHCIGVAVCQPWVFYSHYKVLGIVVTIKFIDVNNV